MKIVAFAGSNSSQSINKKLVTYVAQHFTGEHEVEILDLNDYEMPIYSSDREQKGIPQLALDFASKIDGADFLLISLAEHNGTYSTAFKNLFDWLSRIPNRPHFGDKKMFLMATSPGGRGGLGVLEAAGNRFQYHQTTVVETFSLPFFQKNFDDEKGIIDAEKQKELAEKIEKVKKEIA